MILEGRIRLTFTYAAGDIGSQFLVSLRDRGVILGGVCQACDRVTCPPRSFCAECGGTVNTLVEVGPAGTVEAWTDAPGKSVFALVRLDGADTALVHRLLGPIGRWKPGARVTARFAAARVGNINDIEGFEIDPGGS